MASVGRKVFVLGGESFTPSRADDHNIIHILETSPYCLRVCFFLTDAALFTAEHIKYPAATQPPPAGVKVKLV
jgi:hypothetical protein